MAISAAFQQAVAKGDMETVRIILKDSLIAEPDGKEFDEYSKYARSRMAGLYDVHDGEELISDRSRWTKGYLNSQMVTVVDNFSKERIELLKSMCAVLYRDRIQKKQARLDDVRPRPSPGPGVDIIDEDRKAVSRGVGKVLTAVGATAAVGGIIAAKPVVIALGGGGALVGAVMMSWNKGKR